MNYKGGLTKVFLVAKILNFPYYNIIFNLSFLPGDLNFIALLLIAFIIYSRTLYLLP